VLAALLQRWQRALPRVDQLLPASEALPARLDRPGVTAAELASAERRIGRELPPSYRELLQLTNGWACCGPWATSGGPLLPIERVRPFRDGHAAWIDAYREDDAQPVSLDEHRRYGREQTSARFRAALLDSTLQISDRGAGGVYLLCWDVCDDDGEWEAWHFANGRPGARRLRALRALAEMRGAAAAALAGPPADALTVLVDAGDGSFVELACRRSTPVRDAIAELAMTDVITLRRGPDKLDPDRTFEEQGVADGDTLGLVR